MIQLPARNDSGVKTRILFLERYFLDHTDENHVLSTEDIVNLCTEHRYKTQRVTVADDIESPEYVKDSYETMLKDAAKRQRKLDRDLLKAVKNQRVSSSNKVLEEEN